MHVFVSSKLLPIKYYLKMNSSNLGDLVATFVTKLKKYSISSYPLNVPGSTTGEQLEAIVKALIIEDNDQLIEELNSVEFDFLIDKKLLRTTLSEFLETEKISFEKQIEIEYILKHEAPVPHKALLHDDWVASVDTLDVWILTGCYDGTAHIWNVQNGKHVLTIPAHTAAIKAVQWIRGDGILHTKDEHHFITCSYDETSMVWKWNNKSKQIDHIYTFMGHSRSVDCVNVNHDLVATGSYDHLLKIWSISDSEDVRSETKNKLRSPILTLEGHKEAITGCVWMNDFDLEAPSIVATVSTDNTIKLWDIELAQSKQVLTSSKAFTDIDYSKLNHLLLSSSCDRHIRLWDARIKEGSQIMNVYTSHEGWVDAVCWSSNNEFLFLSASYDTKVKQWDIRSSSAPLYEMSGHHDKVLAVNWSNPEYIVSGSADNQVKIFKDKK